MSRTRLPCTHGCLWTASRMLLKKSMSAFHRLESRRQDLQLTESPKGSTHRKVLKNTYLHQRYHSMVGVGRDLCGSPSPTPAQAGSPRAGCTAPRPGGAGISPEKETGILAPLPFPLGAAQLRGTSLQWGQRAEADTGHSTREGERTRQRKDSSALELTGRLLPLSRPGTEGPYGPSGIKSGQNVLL